MAHKENKTVLGLIARAAQALKGNRKLEFLLYGGIVLLILLLYFSTLLPKEQDAPDIAPRANAADETQLDVEERLCAVLSCIRGAGTVRVMITYESGRELVPAMSTDVDTSTTQSVGEDGKESSATQQNQSSKPATVSGADGTEPIVLTEREPTVRGVVVVAEGAADIAVRLDLQRAVQTVLNVPLANIEVFEMAREP